MISRFLSVDLYGLINNTRSKNPSLMNFAYGEIKDDKELTIGDFLTNFSNTYCVNQIVSGNISLS
jgi:hypothetical protein